MRGVGRLGDADAIGAVSIKATNAAPVLIQDVGIVREGAAIKRGEGSHNAKPAVIVGIQKQPAVNTLELTERIDATLEDIQRALPRGMQIHRDLFRQADFIEQSLANLFTAFIEGAEAPWVQLCRGAHRFACRRTDGHTSAVFLALAELAPDCVGRRAYVDAASEDRVRAMARPCVHVLADSADRGRGSIGGCASGHPRGGPIVSS